MNILVEQTPADEYRSEFPPLYGEHIETAAYLHTEQEPNTYYVY